MASPNNLLSVDSHADAAALDLATSVAISPINQHISTSSLDFLTKINDSEPTHGLLVPSKKRTNSNFAYTMILRGHTYHVCYRRQTPRGERVYWRCQLRGQCKARLITDLDGKIVQFTNPTHSHASSARLNTQQQRCIQALLTTVEENIDLLNGANDTMSSAIPTSSPSHDFLRLNNTGHTSALFESPPNTSSTLSSTNSESPEVKRRQTKASKAQQTGEIDLEEVLRQIPQLQTLRFSSYYNNNEGENDDENNNESAVDEVVPQKSELKLTTETDETLYEDTDSSSVASPNNLADLQRRYLLDSLLQSGWSQQIRDTIGKTYNFADFNEAFGFMNRVALKAEAVHRHPEWTNSYNKVEVTLPLSTTTMTIADLHLAKFMDEIFHH